MYISIVFLTYSTNFRHTSGFFITHLLCHVTLSHISPNDSINWQICAQIRHLLAQARAVLKFVCDFKILNSLGCYFYVGLTQLKKIERPCVSINNLTTLLRESSSLKELVCVGKSHAW